MVDWNTIIVGLLSLLGTCVGSICGVYSSAKLTSYRIEQLEKKVEKHNSVVERTYVMEEKLKVCEHRIGDLERHEEQEAV